MKKKLISILLLICMAANAVLLASCETPIDEREDIFDSSDSNNNVDSDTAMTLTLWIPTDESTTKSAIADVEEAINLITQAKFNTAIKLYAVPDSEYEDAVREYIDSVTEAKRIESEEAAKRREEARKNKKKTDDSTTEAAETTAAEETTSSSAVIENKYSVATTATAGYPSVDKTQVDIFLIRGYDNYTQYVDDNLLEALDSELSTTSKKITSYVYPTFLEAAKYQGQTYAIPNNHPIGQYQYLLLNKKIADAEGIDASRIVSVDRLISSGIIATTASKYSGVTPFYGEITPYGYQYWSSTGTEDFSVLATRVQSDTTGDTVSFKNIFSFNDYIETVANYKSLVESGYVSTDDSVTEFGAGVINATPAEIEQYEDDYYVNILNGPVATLDDLMEASFAVSVYTKDVARSMEIVTLLNTDTEFKTLLQYGVEGTHWKKNINDSSVIEIISDEYKMDTVNTGNEYMTYPAEGVSMDYWSKAKEQNLSSYAPVTLTFTPGEYLTEDLSPVLEELSALSAQYKTRIDAMSSTELRSQASTLSTELSNMELIKMLTYVATENETPKYDLEKSLAYAWNEFYLDTQQ
jgi:hypothetical protein